MDQMKPYAIKKCPQVCCQMGISKTILNSNDTSITSQYSRILYWFTHISHRLSTLDAREKLGIMSPAARIFELRHNYGHNIGLEWKYQNDSSGTSHRVGIYIYFGSSESSNKIGGSPICHE